METELSIVVPMYNEEHTVDELYIRLKRVLKDTNKTYEMIFVDDGSTDQTYQKLETIIVEDNKVKIIKLRGNYGQTPALAAGFENTSGKIIIAMDGDLQHFPEDIPKFLSKIEDGYDIVSGWREERKDSFISRRLPSLIANWLMKKISGVNLHDFGTTFKAYKKHVLEEIHIYGEFHRFIPVLASWMKAKVAEVPILNVKQKYRKSHYNIGRTITVFFDLIRLNFLNNYLSRPLQVFGTFGFALNILGGGITMYLVFMKYFYNLPLLEYRAPLFILGILLIVIGILFIILGLIGEMIVKLFHDTMKVKIFSIENKYGFDD